MLLSHKFQKILVSYDFAIHYNLRITKQKTANLNVNVDQQKIHGFFWGKHFLAAEKIGDS